MIYNIEIENFGPHAFFKADLCPGPNIFLGKNGSGKSNIVYAIGWAILGTRSLPGSYSQKDIIRDGSTKVKVLVELDFLGRRLKFYREYDGRRTFAKIWDCATDETLAHTPTGVLEFLDQHGFDWEAASIPFCRQRDLDTFVHETPANRKSIIASLLQLDSIDQATKWVRSERKKFVLREAPAHFVSKNLLTKVEDEIIETEKKILESKNDLLTADLIYNEMEKQFPTEDEQRKRKKLVQHLADIEAQLNLCRTIRDTYRWAVNQDYYEVSDSSDLKSKLEESKEIAEREVRLQEELVIEARAKHEAYSLLVDDIDDECPLCMSQLEKSKSEELVKNFKSQMELPEETALDEAKGAFYDISNSLDEVLKKITEEKIIEGKNNTIKETRALFDARNAELILLESEKEEIKTDLNNMPVLVSQKIFDNFRKCQESLRQGRQTVLKYENELENHIRARDNLIAQIDEDRIRMLERKKCMKEIETHKSTEKFLVNFRNQLLRDALTWVSGRATQVLQSSGDTDIAPAGSRLELDESLVYSIIHSDGSSYPVYRTSGGQAAVFSTCLRIALSEYLTDRMGMNGLLLLDAIFEPMNEDNRRIAVKAIESYGPPQTLLFSYFDIPELSANRINLV